MASHIHHKTPLLLLAKFAEDTTMCNGKQL